MCHYGHPQVEGRKRKRKKETWCSCLARGCNKDGLHSNGVSCLNSKLREWPFNTTNIMSDVSGTVKFVRCRFAELCSNKKVSNFFSVLQQFGLKFPS